jgi:hypothetical protein
VTAAAVNVYRNHQVKDHLGATEIANAMNRQQRLSWIADEPGELTMSTSPSSATSSRARRPAGRSATSPKPLPGTSRRERRRRAGDRFPHDVVGNPRRVGLPRQCEPASTLMELSCSKTRGLGLPTDRSHGAGPRAWPRLAAEMLGHTSSKITKESYIQPEEAVDPVTAGILESLALVAGPSGMEVVALAADLRTWTQTVAFDGSARPPLGIQTGRFRLLPSPDASSAPADEERRGSPGPGPRTSHRQRLGTWAPPEATPHPNDQDLENRGQSSAERSCPPGADSPQPRSADHRAVRRNIEASGERSRCVRRRG